MRGLARLGGVCLGIAACGSADRPPLAGEALAPCSAVQIGGAGADSIGALALARDGGVVVGGVFSTELELGGRTLRAVGGKDAFAARIRRGGEISWAWQDSSEGLDHAFDAALGRDGDVYVTGVHGERGCFVARLDGARGTTRWRTVLGGGGTHLCRAVHPTDGGQLIVVGATQGELVGGAIRRPGGDSNDWLIARLSADDGAVLGVHGLGGGGNDIARAALELPGGDLIVGGNFSGEVPPAAGALDVGTDVLSSHGDFDALLVRIAPDGAVRWARAFGGPGFDLIKSVALDSSGDIMAVGPVQPGSDYTAFPAPILAGGFHGFLIRQGADGAARFRRAFRGKNVNAHHLVVRGGRVWVVGHFDGTVVVGDRTLRSAGLLDAWVAAFEPDGRAAWVERLGGPATEYGHAIAVGDRELVVAGGFDGTTRLCGASLASRGDTDGYIVWRDLPTAIGR